MRIVLEMTGLALSPALPSRRVIFLILSLLAICLVYAHSEQISSSSRDFFSEEKSSPASETSLTRPLVVDERQSRYPTSYGLENGTFLDNRLVWTEENGLPETALIRHTAGWNVFENIYAFNGSLVIVTSSPSSIPDLKLLFSSGYPCYPGDEEIAKRTPTDADIRIVTPADAQTLFSLETRAATVLDGTSFLTPDPKQFMQHYYHFCAELLFGFWRTYTSLDPSITAHGSTTLPAPRRMIFTNLAPEHWRDYAKLNQFVVRSAFPGMALEFAPDWADRAALHTPIFFPRLVIGDRAAASWGANFIKTWRPAANAFMLKGSPNFWAPFRKSVLLHSGLSEDSIDPPPSPPPSSSTSTSDIVHGDNVVITYISRQKWGRRMLRQADHETLVEELHKLRDQHGYEVNVVDLEKLSQAEQLSLSGRTTIMMGVHGNGLTSLLWMRPRPQATVIEFFVPTGLAFDYEYTTRALGMKHYSVWYNETFTRPNVPRNPKYPEGFHGTNIPLDGKFVAKLVQKRIILNEEEDDDVPHHHFDKALLPPILDF